jgi:mono/diheme cytochrome c family protein
MPINTAAIFGSIVAIACIAAEPVSADTPSGVNLAERWCAQCHGVRPHQISRDPDAPPFAELAAQPSITPYSLRVLLRTPHANMPNFMLEPNDMDELTNYILSLRPSR